MEHPAALFFSGATSDVGYGKTALQFDGLVDAAGQREVDALFSGIPAEFINHNALAGQQAAYLSAACPVAGRAAG